jgi:hypothetical protein
MVNDNTQLYHPGPLTRERDAIKFAPFVGRVLTVDYERFVLTIENPADKTVYTDIRYWPSNTSSATSIDINMPEQFSSCVAAHINYSAGFSQVVILSWINSDQINNIDAVGQRAVDGSEMQGWSDRLRGTYRKAYPGQRTSSYSGGYSEKIDQGWDRLGSDFSRDKLDSDRRTRTQITGRKVNLTGAGVSYHGPINRPNAPNITGVTLPDGTQEFVSYLQPGSQPSDRYIGGKRDVIPFAESTELVQEFSLDYIPPFETIQTELLDSILGTVANPWNRTTVTSPGGQVASDNETFMVSQQWDHPNDSHLKPVGPALAEGSTPARRGFILEKAQGTLVGYNKFDTSTYGRVLKSVLFVGPPHNPAGGRFGADVESGYKPVTDSPDHVEARLAASCLAIRFPYEYNTTRLDVTKEGFTTLEIGASIPKEKVGIGDHKYENPHGAGRSLEAHLVGSAKLVVGKNRDEEEALDIQALGQVVVRLGADDTSLPDARRNVQTQIREKGDAPAARSLQYWDAAHVKLHPGDSGVNPQGYNKVGAENVSLRAALDGAAIVRLGGRNPAAFRRHLINGYADGRGKIPYAVTAGFRQDSHSPGRPNYGAGDSNYAFHDLTQAGQPTLNFPPYNIPSWSGTPVPGKPPDPSNPLPQNSPMDQHGLSLDLHSTNDMLLRVGSNPVSGQSILIDTDGGVVAAIGKDQQGRSLTATLFGGCEISIRANNQGKALRIELLGDIDITHQGHFNFHSTGDWTTECTTWRHITKTDRVFTQQKSIDASLTRATIIAPDIEFDQGSQVPAPGEENS